jgi:signal transduction histidine kinase
MTAENSGSTGRREVEYYNRQGVTRLLGLSVYPIIDQHITSGFLLLGMDITEQRLLEQKLQQAQKLEAIGQLAAGVAHEINTPIQFIGDNLYFLQQTFGKLHQLLNSYEALVDDLEQNQSPETALQNIAATGKAIKLAFLKDEIPHAFTEAIEGISRVTEIVQAMRSFSHPGTQEKTPLNLNKAITDTLTIARNEWKSVAEVETDLDPDLPLVPCLSGEFQQVLLNLIVNAAHAIGDVVSGGNGDRGTITVRTHHDEAWARVEIGDTGTGIPAAVQARIFDPFFTTKEIGKGTGQGLAIAHNIIVNKHGGSLTFETEADRGTTFCICLPLSPAEPAANMQMTGRPS